MKKGDNHKMMDPRMGMIAKQNAVVPGGPQNFNPINVTVNSDNQSVQAKGIYNDFDQNYAQMGTGMVNPQMVQNSGLAQNMPMGQKNNAGIPFGMQQQPPGNGQEPMEGMRLGQEAMQRGLNSSQFMGITGSGVIMPGALDPTIPGGSSPLGAMPTTQQVVGGEMVPGSTPTKIQKKGKK